MNRIRTVNGKAFTGQGSAIRSFASVTNGANGAHNAPGAPSHAARNPQLVPPTGSYETYAKYLLSLLPHHIHQASVYKDELTIYIAPPSIPKVFRFLRDHTNAQFKSIVDICGVDYPTRTPNRFEVVYHLLSHTYGSRIRVKAPASETSFIPTITPLFPGANWFERETYDMYGIMFEGHPDLRRILTDYGFQGHPLRKDFPLTGYTEVRYDDEKKMVVSEPLELTQAFRNFEYQSAWEQVGRGVVTTTGGEPKANPGDQSKKN